MQSSELWRHGGILQRILFVQYQQRGNKEKKRVRERRCNKQDKRTTPPPFHKHICVVATSPMHCFAYLKLCVSLRARVCVCMRASFGLSLSCVWQMPLNINMPIKEQETWLPGVCQLTLHSIHTTHKHTQNTGIHVNIVLIL